MLLRDEASHTYTWAGAPVPGVTSVIKPLYDWLGQIPAHILERKSEIGKATHLACELFDNGDLDERIPLDPLVQPYFDSYLRWLDAEKPVMQQNESYVYHSAHRYAGQLDRVFEMRGGMWWIDLKTTSQISAAVGVQTAAYMQAQIEDLIRGMSAKEASEFKPRRGALQLQADGSIAKLVEFADRDDFAYFLSLLNLYRWREKHVH